MTRASPWTMNAAMPSTTSEARPGAATWAFELAIKAGIPRSSSVADSRCCDDLRRVALRVLGSVKQQAEHGGRQARTADGPDLVERAERRRANPRERAID